MEVGGRVIEGTLEERAQARQDYDTGDRRRPARGHRRGGTAERLHAPRRQPHARRGGDGAARAGRGPALLRTARSRSASRWSSPRGTSRGLPLPGPRWATARPSIPTPCPTPRGSRPRCSCPGSPTRCGCRSSIDLYDHNGCICRRWTPVQPARGPDRRGDGLPPDPARNRESASTATSSSGSASASRDPAEPIQSTLSFHPDGATAARGPSLDADPAQRGRADSPAPRRRLRARPLRQHGGLEDRGGPPGDGADDRHPRRRRPVLPCSRSITQWRLRPAWPWTSPPRPTAIGSAPWSTWPRSTPGAGPRWPSRSAGRRSLIARKPGPATAGRGTTRDAILVLVTDGQVGNEDQILQALAPRLAGIRVFTLGIDRAVNEAFLRRLAELGRGACELVESERPARRGDGGDPSPDRHAAADRPGSRAGGVHDRARLARARAAARPLRRHAAARARPRSRATPWAAWQCGPATRRRRPGPSRRRPPAREPGHRLGLGQGPGPQARRPLRRRRRTDLDELERQIVAVSLRLRRAQPLHRVRRHRPLGGDRTTGQAAPDHPAGGIAGRMGHVRRRSAGQSPRPRYCARRGRVCRKASRVRPRAPTGLRGTGTQGNKTFRSRARSPEKCEPRRHPAGPPAPDGTEELLDLLESIEAGLPDRFINPTLIGKGSFGSIFVSFDRNRNDSVCVETLQLSSDQAVKLPFAARFCPA